MIKIICQILSVLILCSPAYAFQCSEASQETELDPDSIIMERDLNGDGLKELFVRVHGDIVGESVAIYRKLNDKTYCSLYQEVILGIRALDKCPDKPHDPEWKCLEVVELLSEIRPDVEPRFGYRVIGVDPGEQGGEQGKYSNLMYRSTVITDKKAPDVLREIVKNRPGNVLYVFDRIKELPTPYPKKIFTYTKNTKRSSEF